jgi:hypothetical protein
MKQSNHTGPTHVSRRPGAGKRSGPVRHNGSGFSGTGSIPYMGYGSGGSAINMGGSMSAWRQERMSPKGSPTISEKYKKA